MKAEQAWSGCKEGGGTGLPREWLARMVPQEEAGGQEGKGENLPGGPSLAAGLSGWAMEKRHETRRHSFMCLFFFRIQHGSMRHGKGAAPKVNGFFSAERNLFGSGKSESRRKNRSHLSSPVGFLLIVDRPFERPGRIFQQ